MRIRISSWKPVIFIGVIASLCGGISTIAYCRNALYKEVTNWQIGDSNPPARILWQHVELNVPSHQASRVPTNGLAVSDKYVVYWRKPHFSPCDVWQTITAYHIQNGTRAWQYAVPGTIPRDLIGVDDGYLATMEAWLVKLNPEGGVVWRNQTVPSRAAKQAYTQGNFVYVPSFSKIYIFQAKNGKLDRVIEVSNIVDYWEDAFLTMRSSDTLSLHFANEEREAVTLKVSNQALIAEYSESLAKFTYRFNDILIVHNYFTPPKLQAFHMNDGRLLWERSGAFSSPPIMFNEMLAIYAADRVLFFDLLTGETKGYIQLVRVSSDSITPIPNPLRIVWLGASQNILSIYFRDTSELLTLEVDPTDSNK